MKQHLDSVSQLKKKGLNTLIRGLPNWSGVSPELRLDFIKEKFRDHFSKDDEKEDLKENKKQKDKKRPPIKPVPIKNPPKGTIPRPSPIRQPNEQGPISDIVPPFPPEMSSPTPPPRKTKTQWDSRVGYFVTLSDISWYSEVPRIQESPNVNISFMEKTDQYLSLAPGDSWTSDWYTTGVIRGLNVDVLGKHKLNYAKNGDFEQ